MRSVPRRTTRILGIDANGHVGRYGGAGIGDEGQERRTNNGPEIEKITARAGMIAPNTLNSCRNAGWTWQKRDGTGSGRMDYLLVDWKMLGLVRSNIGAKENGNCGTQGSATNHRPIAATIRVTTLQELGKEKEKNKNCKTTPNVTQ